MAKLPPPHPLAMIVCDATHRDPGTGKVFILGCFSVIHAHEFPATHQEMTLYISLTSGRGEIPITVRLVDVDEEDDPIAEVSGQLEIEDPRFVADISLKLLNVTFPKEGEYRFQLFASGEFVMERRIIAKKLHGSESE